MAPEAVRWSRMPKANLAPVLDALSNVLMCPDTGFKGAEGSIESAIRWRTQGPDRRLCWRRQVLGATAIIGVDGNSQRWRWLGLGADVVLNFHGAMSLKSCG